MCILRAAIPIIATATLMIFAWSLIKSTTAPVQRTIDAPITQPAPQTDLILEHRTVGDRAYILFRSRKLGVRLTLTRPSLADSHIVFAVPGTYTSPQNTVEGFVVLDGQIVQARERQAWDGAIIIDNGHVRIVATENGKILTRAYLQDIVARDASLIQTHLLVYSGTAQHFKPQTPFPRRALAVLTNGSPAIIESVNAIELTTFAEDLAVLGVNDAANLDMGAWSEGWYRDPASSATITIGIPTPSTARQTNWIIFTQ